jgi:hypothetical protein
LLLNKSTKEIINFAVDALFLKQTILIDMNMINVHEEDLVILFC